MSDKDDKTTASPTGQNDASDLESGISRDELEKFKSGQNSAENKDKEAEWREKLADSDSTLNGGGKKSKPKKGKSDDKSEKGISGDKKPRRVTLIIGLIFVVLFLIAFIYYLASGQNRNVQQVRQAQTGQVERDAKNNPKVRKALDNAQGKNYDAGKETDESQLSKAQVKQQLDKYNAINSRSTLVMLKLHDALVTATQNKSASDYQNKLNQLQTEIQNNSNVLASVNQSGQFKPLYDISQKRSNEISKLITHEQNTKVIDLLTAEYNRQAQKSNEENQQFLSAFKNVLDSHKIEYSVDDQGNFSY